MTLPILLDRFPDNCWRLCQPFLMPLALALLTGCEDRGELVATSSITVKLPPPRPLASAPGFSFQGGKKLRG